MSTQINQNTIDLQSLLALANSLPDAGSGSSDPVLQDKTITENGTYSADAGYDGLGEVTVNVATSGGGDDIISAILDKSITSITHNTVTTLGTYVFRECKSLVSVSFPAVTELESYVFYNCTALSSVNLPVLDNIASYAFRGCTALKVIDLPVLGSISTNAFYGCTKLNTLILRSSTMCKLSGTNAFTNTYFAPGGSGGTAYVPSALISEYQSATNWASLPCTFVAIEGSDYE